MAISDAVQPPFVFRSTCAVLGRPTMHCTAARWTGLSNGCTSLMTHAAVRAARPTPAVPKRRNIRLDARSGAEPATTTDRGTTNTSAAQRSCSPPHGAGHSTPADCSRIFGDKWRRRSWPRRFTPRSPTPKNRVAASHRWATQGMGAVTRSHGSRRGDIAFPALSPWSDNPVEASQCALPRHGAL